MLNSLLKKRQWFFVALLGFTPLFIAAQCAEKIQNLPITFTINQSTEFEADIDQAMGQANIKVENGKIPQGAPTVPLPINIKETFDISNDPNIIKYGQKIDSIEIRAINVEVIQNSVNIDIPRVNILIGDKNTEPSQEVGYHSGIKANTTGQIENIIKNSAMTQTINKYLIKFAFAIGASTTIEVKGGQAAPKGKVKLKMIFDLKFTVKPLK
jgi:hypothetical protein